MGGRKKTGLAILIGAMTFGPSVALTPMVSLFAVPGSTEAAEQDSATDQSSTESDRPDAPIVVAQAQVHGAREALREAVTRVVAVKSGDTLMNVVLKVGVPRGQAHDAIVALRKVFDPRKLRPGQELTVKYIPKATSDDEIELRSLRLRINAYQDYIVNNDASGFDAKEHKSPLTTELVRRQGVIDSSLIMAGDNAGLSLPVMFDLVRLYSWDVDFQRDIQTGDRFDVVFERVSTLDGEVVREGNILYANLILSGHELPLYRFEYAPGQFDYFDPKGGGVRKALMKTPVDGARLSSRFGRRRHPILGYTRMHRGVDFAAPMGTPIYAAGDGVIVQRGRNSGYGNYIRIRHNSQYSTAYGHMKAFKAGLHRGSRVKQGQVIGYVGSTGQSTGPHLHYEILAFGHQVNPLGVKLRAGRTLKGKQLKTFLAERLDIDRRVAVLAKPTTTADAQTSESD